MQGPRWLLSSADSDMDKFYARDMEFAELLAA